jgi:hypothetical protein
MIKAERPARQLRFSLDPEGLGALNRTCPGCPERSRGGTREIDGSDVLGNFFHTRLGDCQMATRKKLTPEQVSIIKARIAEGEYQHRIAADFDLNQGRISEIATGKRFASVPVARMEDHHV